MTAATLKAAIRLKYWQVRYELSTAAGLGNTGGPVIDVATAKVVGVLTTGIPDGAKAFCIPVSALLLVFDPVPAERPQEIEAARTAKARHALDYVAARLPAVEANAQVAMQLQLLRLKNGTENVNLKVDAKTVQFADVMSDRKGSHGRTLQDVTKLLQIQIVSNAVFSATLKQAIRERLEACNSMRDLAGARTEKESSFVKALDSRKLASEKKVKAFELEYEKFFDQTEKAVAPKPK